jgi:hypothetical protein
MQEVAMSGDNRNRERHTDRDADTNVKANPDRDQSNTVKDPDEWTTGDEPMTGAQQSYLKTLSEEAHEPFDPNLTKADASKRIDELQAKTGRGQKGGESGGR